MRHRDTIPELIEREQTSELVTGLAEAMGDRTPRVRRLTPEQIVQELVTRAHKAGTPRKFLGLSLGDAVKFGLAIAAAVGTAYAGIQRGIEDNSAAVIELREKQSDAAESVQDLGHRLGGIERKTDQLETRQQVILEGVREIRDELRGTRRRR